MDNLYLGDTFRTFDVFGRKCELCQLFMGQSERGISTGFRGHPRRHFWRTFVVWILHCAFGRCRSSLADTRRWESLVYAARGGTVADRCVFDAAHPFCRRVSTLYTVVPFFIESPERPFARFAKE